MRPGDSSGGIIYSSGNGSSSVGFDQLSVTHPYK